MVKHAVYHYAYAKTVGFCCKSFHILIASKGRIDFLVVGYIIFVVRGAFAYWVKVNSGYSQIPKVFKLRLYTVKVAAVLSQKSYLFVGLRPFFKFKRPFCTAVAKSVRKNLVPYSSVYPGGRFNYIGRVHPREEEVLTPALIFLKLLFGHKGILGHIKGFVFTVKYKEITAPFEFRLYHRFPKQMVLQLFYIAHFYKLSAPRILSAKQTAFKGIAIHKLNPVNVISCFNFYNKLIIVNRVTVIAACYMSYSCKLHKTSPLEE